MSEQDCFISFPKRSMQEAPPALWRVSHADAVKICSDDRTKGKNFFLCWYWASTLGENFRWVKDDGRFDTILQELGITIKERKEVKNEN